MEKSYLKRNHMKSERKFGKALGDLETEIMNVIWKSKGSISVKEVALKIREDRQVAYTMVMTVMERIKDKGLLSRELNLILWRGCYCTLCQRNRQHHN